MSTARRRREAADFLAYHQSLPARRAGVLFLLTVAHAVIRLLLSALFAARLALLVRRVRNRRAAGAPPLSRPDADRSLIALLAVAVVVGIVRRIAVAVLRHRTAAAIRAGRADPAAAARLLADPIAGAKSFTDLRRDDPGIS
jgi:hypothetical protein